MSDSTSAGICSISSFLLSSEVKYRRHEGVAICTGGRKRTPTIWPRLALQRHRLRKSSHSSRKQHHGRAERTQCNGPPGTAGVDAASINLVANLIIGVAILVLLLTDVVMRVLG